MKPYIGITGFKSKKEIQAVEQCFYQNGFPNAKYTAMFGILTSEKRIFDDKPGKRSPALSEVKELIDATPHWALGMLHYYQENSDDFAKNLIYLHEKTEATAAQLNIAWPAVDEIQKIKKNGYNIITMQLPQIALHGLTNTAIAKKIKPYKDVADYTLIDLSGGLGIPFDIQRSNELVSIVREALPNTCIGIAGGINAQILTGKISQVNCNMFDAESGLMTNNTLDMQKVQAYIMEASKL